MSLSLIDKSSAGSNSAFFIFTSLNSSQADAIHRRKASKFCIHCSNNNQFIPPRKYLNEPKLPIITKSSFFQEETANLKKMKSEMEENEILEIFQKLSALNFWEDIDGLLNTWNGRFNRKHFQRLILEVTKSGDWKKSMKVFTWMKAQRCYRAKTEIYNILINLAARHRKLNQARHLFSEMQEWRCKPDVLTYDGLILAHARFGDYKNALKFVDTMLRNKVPPSTSTYNNIINACASSGKWKEALSILDQMKSNGIYIDLITHNTILTSFKNGQQYDKAIEYFDKMNKRIIPCPPDIISYTIALTCLSKTKQYERLFDLFRMLDSHKPYSPLHPNLIILNVIMHAYASQAKSKHAQDVFDRIVGEGMRPCMVSFNTLIQAYANTKDTNNAQSVFDSLVNYDLKPDIVSFTTLINAYAKSNQGEKVKHVFEHMKRQHIKPNLMVYNSLIDAFSKKGNIQEAEEFKFQMEEAGIQPSVVTYTSLISACRMTRQHEKAFRYFREAKVYEIIPNTFFYNSILHVLMECGQYDKVKGIVMEMREESILFDESTYGIMIDCMGKVGKVEEARRLYEEIKKKKNLKMTVPIFSSLISAFAIKGLHEEARKIFEEMKEMNISPNVVTCTSLLQAYGRAGLVENAERFFEEMKRFDFHLDVVAYSLMMSIYNKNLLYEKALCKGDEFIFKQSQHVNEIFCNEYLLASVKVSEWRKAMELYENVKSNSSISESKNMFSLFHYNLMLQVLSESEKDAMAFKIFMHMKTENVIPSLLSYNLLLRSFSNAFRWKTCLKVLEWMKESGMKGNALSYKFVILSFSKEGLWEKALQIFDSMNEVGIVPDRSTYLALLTVVKNGGQEDSVAKFETELKKQSHPTHSLDAAFMPLLRLERQKNGIGSNLNSISNSNLFSTERMEMNRHHHHQSVIPPFAMDGGVKSMEGHGENAVCADCGIDGTEEIDMTFERMNSRESESDGKNKIERKEPIVRVQVSERRMDVVDGGNGEEEVGVCEQEEADQSGESERECMGEKLPFDSNDKIWSALQRSVNMFASSSKDSPTPS